MKKIIFIALVLCSLVVFTSCSIPASKPTQQLSIGVLPDVDSIPLIIARQQGFFEKEGVNIKIESFKSAPDRDSALQSGRIDGAVSDMLAAAFAREGGFDVKITSKTDGSYKLLVKKDSNVKSISDIKGKGIAISKNTIIEYATDTMLTTGGLKSSDIEKIIIPQIPTRLEMLQNGKIDGATLPEPLASVAVKNGAKLIDSTDKLGINPGVLLFTSKSMESKANEIKAFYKAYNSAVEYLQKEPVSSYVDILVKEVGFPEDVKNTITLPAYTKAVLPSEKDCSNVLKWLKEKDLIKKDYSFKELVDSKFVR